MSSSRLQTINAAVYTIEQVLVPNITISSPAPAAAYEQSRANVTASPTTTTSNTTAAPTTTVAARSSAARSTFSLAYTLVLAAALLLALMA
jgi:hypothetical protein